MNVSFDHLVHFVKNPSHAVEKLRELGIHAVEGGRHEYWGTYNSLSYFDLSYIEFLGIFDRELAEQASDNLLVRQAVERLPKTEGFARIALRTKNIAEAADHLRQQGLSLTGPFPGSRTRLDGVVLNWSMLFVESDDSGIALPFFIQWGQSDEERRKDLQANGVISPHPRGELALQQVAFAVNELEATTEKWSRWFQLERSEPYFDESLNATCRTLSLPGGNLVFCSPKGSGIVSKVLEERGETPFLLRLSTTGEQISEEVWGSLYQVGNNGHNQ